MVDTHTPKLPDFPDPASATIRRYFVEGNGSILGGGSTKLVNVLKLPLVTSRSYWATGWVMGRIANDEQGTFAKRALGLVGSWDGSAWEATHPGPAGPTSSSDAAQMDATFAVAGTPANGFTLSLIPDKDDNTYFWWRYQIIEIDTSFPALP